MSANIWEADAIVRVDADNTILHQHFTVTDTAQVLYELTQFAYTYGTNSLAIYVNGVLQRLDVDYTEGEFGNYFTLTAPFLQLGDTITAIGYSVIAVTVPSLSPEDYGGIAESISAFDDFGSIL